MYHSFFIHSSVDGHLGCFHVLAVVNSVAMNNGIHVSFSSLVSLGYMSRSRIAESYGVFFPSFSRNLHTIFHSGCISLHYQQQCKRVPFSPYSLQHLFVDFLRMDILNRCEVISYFDFHVSNNKPDIEHLFTCLLTNCMSSLEKCLFRSFSQF